MERKEIFLMICAICLIWFMGMALGALLVYSWLSIS